MARLLAALLLPVFVPLAVIAVDRPLLGEPIPLVQERKTELVWAGRAFTTKAEFERFLTSRGASYERWEANHPGAAPWEPRSARPRDVFAGWAAASFLALLILVGPPRLRLRARSRAALARASRISLPRPRAGPLVRSAGASIAAAATAAPAVLRRLRPRGSVPRVARPEVRTHVVELPRGAMRRLRPLPTERAAQPSFHVVSYAAARDALPRRPRDPRILHHRGTAPAISVRRVRRELADRGTALIVFYVVGAILAIGVGPFIVVLMSRL